MAVQVYDPYPLETAWRETLPVDNVLHNLEYGLMSEFIFDLVKEFRSNKRHQKVQTLIRSITQENLHILWQHILQDARGLNGFNRKAWTFGNTSKSGRVKFFEKNDISIKYLEECLDLQQNSVKETFEVDDLVIIATGKGIVEDSYKIAGIVTKVYRSTLDVNLVKVQNSTSGPISRFQRSITPLWHRNLRDRNHVRMTKKRVNFTRCEKVGTYTPELKQKRSDWVKNHNAELKKRREFWNRYFEPVIGTMVTWGMPIQVKSVMFSSWFCQENVIWDKEKPIYYNEDKSRIQWHLWGNLQTLYDNQWKVFKEIMDENLDDFLRDYRP